jgi:hypothetical protein
MIVMKLRTKAMRLLPHAGQQLPAADAARKARMIVGARNKARTTSTHIDHQRPQAEAGQVDGGREPGRSSPDYEAIRLQFPYTVRKPSFK